MAACLVQIRSIRHADPLLDLFNIRTVALPPVTGVAAGAIDAVAASVAGAGWVLPSAGTPRGLAESHVYGGALPDDLELPPAAELLGQINSLRLGHIDGAVDVCMCTYGLACCSVWRQVDRSATCAVRCSRARPEHPPVRSRRGQR